MPLVKPRSPSIQLSHRLSEGLAGAWVMPERAGLRSRDSAWARLVAAFGGTTVPTCAVGPTGPVVVYGATAYSLLFANVVSAAVPSALIPIGAVGSTYSIVSRIITSNNA